PFLLDLALFICKHWYSVNLHCMVAQIAGCSIAAEAWRPTDRLDGAQPDLSDTFHFLYEEVESYLEEKKRNFNELVQKNGFSTRLRKNKLLLRKNFLLKFEFSNTDRISFRPCFVMRPV